MQKLPILRCTYIVGKIEYTLGAAVICRESGNAELNYDLEILLDRIFTNSQ